MDKKYRLLKDLPGIKAGAVSSHDGVYFMFEDENGEEAALFAQDRIDLNPDWFEEVKDENPEKIKKGTVMVCKSDKVLKVVYTGKGKEFGEFSGVVIQKAIDAPFKLNEYSANWNLSAFKPAQ